MDNKNYFIVKQFGEEKPHNEGQNYCPNTIRRRNKEIYWKRDCFVVKTQYWR